MRSLSEGIYHNESTMVSTGESKVAERFYVPYIQDSAIRSHSNTALLLSYLKSTLRDHDPRSFGSDAAYRSALKLLYHILLT